MSEAVSLPKTPSFRLDGRRALDEEVLDATDRVVAMAIAEG